MKSVTNRFLAETNIRCALHFLSGALSVGIMDSDTQKEFAEAIESRAKQIDWELKFIDPDAEAEQVLQSQASQADDDISYGGTA